MLNEVKHLVARRDRPMGRDPRSEIGNPTSFAHDDTRRPRASGTTKNPSSRSGTKGLGASAVPPWLIEGAGPGGAEGTRTPYLNTASVALSRMSYSPRRSRRGLDPLWLPGNGGVPAMASGRSRFTTAAHGRVQPNLPPCTTRRLANRRAYYSRSQPPKDSRDLRRMSNRVRALGLGAARAPGHLRSRRILGQRVPAPRRHPVVAQRLTAPVPAAPLIQRRVPAGFCETFMTRDDHSGWSLARHPGNTPVGRLRRPLTRSGWPLPLRCRGSQARRSRRYSSRPGTSPPRRSGSDLLPG